MNRTRSSRAAAKSRRRFLKVVAMGSAVGLVSALPRVGDAAKRPAGSAAKRKHAPGTRPPAIEAEIAKQKHSTADLLKTIRDYPLPSGSEMAFAFAPVRAARRRSAPRAARGTP